MKKILLIAVVLSGFVPFAAVISRAQSQGSDVDLETLNNAPHAFYIRGGGFLQFADSIKFKGMAPAASMTWQTGKLSFDSARGSAFSIGYDALLGKRSGLEVDLGVTNGDQGSSAGTYDNSSVTPNVVYLRTTNSKYTATNALLTCRYVYRWKFVNLSAGAGLGLGYEKMDAKMRMDTYELGPVANTHTASELLGYTDSGSKSSLCIVPADVTLTVMVTRNFAIDIGVRGLWRPSKREFAVRSDTLAGSFERGSGFQAAFVFGIRFLWPLKSSK